MAGKWFQYATPESVGISSKAVEKLIDTMCLNDRYTSNPNISEEINYSKTNEILLEERKKSIGYLESVIEGYNG